MIIVGYKDDENLYHYVLGFHKWMFVQEILMKLNVFFFLIKDDDLLEKYNKFGIISTIV